MSAFNWNYNDIFRTKFIIPTAYGQALSYYEQLVCLANAVEEIAKAIDINMEEVSKLIEQKIALFKEYVDSQDTNIRTDIGKNINNLQNQINAINEELLNLHEEIGTVQSDLHQEILNYYNLSTNYTDVKVAQFDGKLQAFEDKIMKIIEDYTIICLNPTNGLYEKTCKVINDIYQDLRYNAFTALQFDNMSFTAEQFDNYNLTAKEFDLRGLELIGNNICTCKMLNPFTGQIDLVTNVINTIVEGNAHGLTASAYDALELTATVFDSKETTAYDFDFNGITA